MSRKSGMPREKGSREVKHMLRGLRYISLKTAS
jgi:hypothetical protein